MSNSVYQDYVNYRDGANGYPKNPAKAMKFLKKAADAGHPQACADMAATLIDKKPQKALEYFEKGNAKDLAVENYLKTLYVLAKKCKKNTAKASVYFDKAKDMKLSGNAQWYFAKLTLFAGKGDSEYRLALMPAIMQEAPIVPDEDFASVGRERGVVFGSAEFAEWKKSPDAKYFEGFYSAMDNMAAVRAALANLDEKVAKESLGGAGVRALKKWLNAAESKGYCDEAVLEYQPILRFYLELNSIELRYKHDNPNYTTITTGSGTKPYPDKLCWHGYYASYVTDTKANDNILKFHDRPLSKEPATTKESNKIRYRWNPKRYTDLISKGFSSIEGGVKSRAQSDYKSDLARKYNWNTAHITTTVNSANITNKRAHIMYVPFWFFTQTVGKHTFTLRVNATTGDVNYFVDNPFGQFGLSDTVTSPNAQKYTLAAMKAKAKSDKAYKKANSLPAKAIGAVKDFLGGIIDWIKDLF